jgi:hypothetical protein
LAKDLSPTAYKAVQQALIAGEKLTRGGVNRRVDLIRRIFRWAAENELVPITVYEALRAVSPLKSGRCELADNDPVGQVNDGFEMRSNS